MAAISVVSGEMWPKFKLLQAFIVILVTCKNEDPFKNEGVKRGHNISLIISIWGFLQTFKGS